MPGCLIREFLPSNVATFLGIPSHPLREELIRLGGAAAGARNWRSGGYGRQL
jgi:hypothetical protein